VPAATPPALAAATTVATPAVATPAVMTPATAALPSVPAPNDPLAAANEALRQGDDVVAYRLVRSLGDTGSPRALEMLGRLTEEGRGTAPSALQAYIWYGLAVKRGQASARAAADRVARRLQPAEIAQAERVIQRWPVQ
jgi:TPR repeat protein